MSGCDTGCIVALMPGLIRLALRFLNSPAIYRLRPGVALGPHRGSIGRPSRSPRLTARGSVERPHAACSCVFGLIFRTRVLSGLLCGVCGRLPGRRVRPEFDARFDLLSVLEFPNLPDRNPASGGSPIEGVSCGILF